MTKEFVFGVNKTPFVVLGENDDRIIAITKYGVMKAPIEVIVDGRVDEDYRDFLIDFKKNLLSLEGDSSKDGEKTKKDLKALIKKVYLPSKADIEKYLPNPKDRLCSAAPGITAPVMAGKLTAEGNPACKWWTASTKDHSEWWKQEKSWKVTIDFDGNFGESVSTYPDNLYRIVVEFKKEVI